MAPIDYSIKGIEKLVKFDGQVKNVEVSRLTAPGENFISLVLRVDFEVLKNGHSKTISSIAKRLPLGNQNHGFGGFDIHGHAMKSEIKWYSEIVPLLKEFAKENDIKLDFYPEYYGSRYSLDPSKQEADKDSVLILENLIPQGYQNDDRYIGSDLNTSKAILKSLALFHALPIVIKVKKPELFQILKEFLAKSKPEPPPAHDGHRKPPGSPSGPGEHNGPPGPPGRGPPGHPGGGRRPEDLLFEELIKLPDFAPYISKIKPFFDKPAMGPPDFNKLTKEPWNTITHNDFWVNNVMVNYRKENEVLVKIVDFQLGSYGSYAKDLVFFLMTSVRNDVTRECMDDLIRVYYDELISVIRNANVNLELTYEEYLEEVRTVAQSEVPHAISFSTIIFGEKGTGADVAVEGFDPEIQMKDMLKKMNQYQKDKMVLMASEAIKRNWI